MHISKNRCRLQKDGALGEVVRSRAKRKEREEEEKQDDFLQMDDEFKCSVIVFKGSMARGLSALSSYTDTTKYMPTYPVSTE